MDAVKHMRAQASYFARDDWEYTSDLGTLEMSYQDSRDRAKPLRRIQEALDWLLHYPKWAEAFDGNGPWHRRAAFRLQMFWYELFQYRPSDLPDAKVGSVLTFWMEDGLYIEMVQPSVGLLLADFLEQEPDNHHAQKIRAEMQRLLDAHDERIKRAREES